MKYARLVLAYHGCTREVAEQVLFGDAALAATILGTGWATASISGNSAIHARSTGRGARAIQLTNCLDLLDTEHPQLLSRFTPDLG
jgi:hypothetical protein